MPDFRRGATAIAKAQEKTGGKGSFRPFAPKLFWKDDGEEKFLLFLNPVEDIPTVNLINFIPVTQKKANGDKFTYSDEVIARTDQAIGENEDPMTDDWDATPRETCVAVAVELEPEFETRNGRQKPKGFTIKTTSFERAVRDEEGKRTDDYEEVEAPVIGFITQSPKNFFNVVSAYDANEAPIEDTPVKVVRVGKDTSTVYTIAGYEDQEINRGNLIDLVEGISYLGDDLDDLLSQIDGVDDEEAGTIIGAFMLDKRLEELTDKDRYDDLYNGITTSLDKFGNKKKAVAKKAPVRRQRRGKEEAPVEETEKPKRSTRAKAIEEDEAPVAKQKDSAAIEKLNELRAKTAKRASAKSA